MLSDNIEKLEKEIAEREGKLQSLKEERTRLVNELISMKVARVLHDILCHSNHTDGGDWMYKGNTYAKRYYSNMAELFLTELANRGNNFTEREQLDIVEALCDAKKKNRVQL